MNRIDRIFNFIREKTESLTDLEIDMGQGVTTKMVADAFDVQRSNVSKDLNQ